MIYKKNNIEFGHQNSDSKTELSVCRLKVINENPLEKQLKEKYFGRQLVAEVVIALK